MKPPERPPWESEQELIECRSCGNQFDLNEVRYYDNECPSCKDTVA